MGPARPPFQLLGGLLLSHPFPPAVKVDELCFDLYKAGGFCLACVVGVAANYYDVIQSWHIKLHVSIARDHHEFGERYPSKDCVVSPSEGDDLEAKELISIVLQDSKDDLQCYLS